jgi:DNA-binding transcriptional ArsR family regulator
MPVVASPAPTKAHAAPKLDPVAVLFAIGSPVRLPIVQMMADGREMTTSDVAEALGRDFDAVSKHMRVLSNAGVADWRIGEDRRLIYYFIPAGRRPEPGVLDYGFCVIRLNRIVGWAEAAHLPASASSGQVKLFQ